MMVKKVFALASVMAVGALTFAVGVSGCSSSDNTGSTNVSDAKADRTPVTIDDASTNLCYSEDPLDATQLKYSSPNVQVGACTTANVTDLVAYIKGNANATFADLQTHIKTTYTAACTACIFSDQTAALWGPIITDATQGGVVIGVNGGGCIEIVSGKGNACGKAYHQWDQCIDSACSKCTDDQEYSDCTGAVQDTACLAASQALVTACGSSINAYITACRGTYGVDEWINRSCVEGAPLTDGGTDAGDGGDASDGAAHL